MSGTPLPPVLLAELARAVPLLQYAKIESPFAATAIRALAASAGDALPGLFDGEEGITLIPDLEAGAVGTMPSAMIPEVLGDVVRRWHGGDHAGATELWESWLPMIHFENRQCGLRATKLLMKEGGVIRSAATRAPFGPVAPAIEASLLAHAQRRDPLILRWACDR